MTNQIIPLSPTLKACFLWRKNPIFTKLKSANLHKKQYTVF